MELDKKSINKTLCLKLHLFNYAKHDLSRELSEYIIEELSGDVIKSIAIIAERKVIKNTS